MSSISYTETPSGAVLYRGHVLTQFQIWSLSANMLAKYLQGTSGCNNFAKIQEPRQYSLRQTGDIKQFPYGGPTNIRRHSTKFSRHCDRPGNPGTAYQEDDSIRGLTLALKVLHSEKALSGLFRALCSSCLRYEV